MKTFIYTHPPQGYQLAAIKSGSIETTHYNMVLKDNSIYIESKDKTFHLISSAENVVLSGNKLMFWCIKYNQSAGGIFDIVNVSTEYFVIKYPIESVYCENGRFVVKTTNGFFV